MNPLRELLFRLQQKKFECSYESTKHTCKNETQHGLVEKESAPNPGRKTRSMGNAATSKRIR